MYNFYPGPSKIYPEIKQFALEAFESGILEKNHRSDDFMEMLKACTQKLKAYFHLPPNYRIFFTSSATEAWEITAQSFLFPKQTTFVYNGAFGKKWAEYSNKLCANKAGIAYNYESEIPTNLQGDIAFVVNETSNGTQVKPNRIASIRANTTGLIALDVVSSLGGVQYDFSKGDIWIASSQKCLGLPAGMGLMFVSEAAFERAKEKKENNHYNSALFMAQNFDQFQTPYTPNILSFYLLSRWLDIVQPMNEIHLKIAQRSEKLYAELGSLLVQNPEVRSNTVLAIKSDKVKETLTSLKEQNIILGKGYGEWKNSTYRIANFPAINDSEYDFLLENLRKFTTL